MSDLARMLQAHDFEIWTDDDDMPGGADDVIGASMAALKSMAAEFNGLAQKLDVQTASSTSTNEQLAMLNKSVAALLASQAATQQAILDLGRALAAPKRLVKDANGKPIGVEVMT